MEAQADVEVVRAALERYGRRARRLSPSRLMEFREVVGFLKNDSETVSAAAERVAARLTQIIEGIIDPVDRRIAEALLASKPEFYEKTVSMRQAHVREHDVGFSDDQYKTRRRRIIRDVAAALIEAASLVHDGELLSTSAQRCARDLAWATQHLIAYLEAFDYSVRVLELLPKTSNFRQFGSQLLHARTVYHDDSLWWFARCNAALHALTMMPAGRDYIRRTARGEWHLGTFRHGFLDRDIAVLRSALKSFPDEPSDFATHVRSTHRGVNVANRWARLLRADGAGDEHFSRYRADLIDELIGAHAAVAPVAGDDRSIPEGIGDHVANELLIIGPVELGAVLDDESGRALFRAQRDALIDGRPRWIDQSLWQAGGNVDL